jgi:hypothetical protein
VSAKFITREQAAEIQAIAKQGVRQMVDSILAMMAVMDADDVSVQTMAMIRAGELFRAVEVDEGQTEAERVVRAAIIETVFPSSQ